MNPFERAKNIVLLPAREWRLIERESGEPGFVFGRYVAPLALIPAIFGFIGQSVIGISVSAGTFRVPLLPGAVNAILSYLFSFVIVYLTALVIFALAPLFDGDRYFPNALKLAAYSFTPVWLVGVFLILPGLQFMAVFGLYGIFLLWVGMPVLLRAPLDKAVLFAGAVAVAAILITLILAALQQLIIVPGVQGEGAL
ncbi:MAG TPA: Yip1 family protein [Pseudorhodoplanes sp.]|jgi:hypothetical protein|nr:Yip1 family protein [Pseudorhodoplanes sp.]